MTEKSFLPLPNDDEILIPRRDAHKYGFPQPQTFNRWASEPSTAPCVIEYTFVGRLAAMSVGTLRKLRRALTYQNTTQRTAARIERLEREVSTGAETA